jgi:4-aminobutyrate aminotransferase-like enzyme
VVYNIRAARTARDQWVLRTLSTHEPDALHTQMPIVWDSALGARVQSSDGRSWLDWTSGIAVTNAGHSQEAVVTAIVEQAQCGPLHSYQFPTEVRARFVEALSRLTGLQQCVLYSTGAEAVEGALKICRLHAQRSSRAGSVIISFDGGFHGRTQGAQYVGGQSTQRAWLPHNDADYIRLPYPEETVDTVSASLQRELANRAIDPDHVAALIIEPWQGSTLRQLSVANARALRTWCTEHGIPLILDEIQTGFGRSGSLFAFHGLDITPDLLLVSKGLSGSLPVAAVCLADRRWTTYVKRGELTSTHGGNPVALAGALANLALYADGALIENAHAMGTILQTTLRTWASDNCDRRQVRGTGMIAGVIFFDGDGKADLDLPRKLVHDCAEQGLLMVTPATMGGAMVKIMPPLTTTAEELDAGLQIFCNTADSLLSEQVSAGVRQ